MPSSNPPWLAMEPKVVYMYAGLLTSVFLRTPLKALDCDAQYWTTFANTTLTSAATVKLGQLWARTPKSRLSQWDWWQKHHPVSSRCNIEMLPSSMYCSQEETLEERWPLLDEILRTFGVFITGSQLRAWALRWDVPLAEVSCLQGWMLLAESVGFGSHARTVAGWFSTPLLYRVHQKQRLHCVRLHVLCAKLVL